MSRKKITLQEEVKEPVEWDRKKIVVASIIFFGFLGSILAVNNFLFSSKKPSQQKVEGISASSIQDNSYTSLPSLKSIQQGVQETLGHIQKQAQSISVEEIASSSPQVKQILQQLQQLPNLPQSVAKQTCEQLCSKL